MASGEALVGLAWTDFEVVGLGQGVFIFIQALSYPITFSVAVTQRSHVEWQKLEVCLAQLSCVGVKGSCSHRLPSHG